MTTVASFTIDYRQVMNEKGELVASLPEFAQDDNALLSLYKLMVHLREFDKKAVTLQRTGRMGTYASTLGQEAIGTALGDVMQKDDVLCPYYRDYGTQLQRNVTMVDLFRYWGGDEWGSCYEGNPDDFPISVPIASQCLHAAGVASAFAIRNERRVAVATIGEGGTSEGDFYEALNVSGAWNLPYVCLVNNNRWAISVPIEKQTACETIAQKAIAAGIHGVQVDGNDIIAVRHVLAEAFDRARNGGGATLVEALTYRLCDHTTADDASRYRTKAELEAAWKAEPILRLRQYLENKGIWSADANEDFICSSKALVEEAVAIYENSPKAPVTDMFDYHFANMPHELLLQREEAEEDSQHG